MKHSIKKISALFLAVVMIATMASVSALATDTYGDYYTISTNTYGTASRLFVTDKTKVPENAVVPDGVTIIGYTAFCNIPQLKTVTVPTSVTEFDRTVFGSNITDIYYKGTEVQWNAIKNSGKVNSNITIHCEGGTGNSPSFLTIENGVLTRCNTAAIGEITVPSGVTAIGDSAFSRCQYITSVILPEGVTSIDDWAFNDCWKLTSITFPSTFKSFGVRTFNWCNKLTDIYYAGSQSEWEAIMQNNTSTIAGDDLANVTIHYGKTDSTSSNNTGSTTVTKARFKDVATTAYYNDSVNWAIQNGITNGTTDTTFSPDDTCTTAQIITFLYRAAGSPSHNNTNSYGVTNKSLYYYDALCWASENLIVTSATFNPYEKCTRATVLLYMWRAAGSPYVTNTANFTDMPSGETSWAITWAVQKGITNGIGNNQFGPNLTVTRAQAVTFMYREQN
jgi:hypothetical protein